MIDKDNLINHLKTLVAFKTVEGNFAEQKKCLDYIKEQFTFYPFHIAEYESNGKPSLVLTTEKTKHPKIFLVAHIDVVPGKESLFKLHADGDKIIGRGVCDMKFAIATYICVLEALYKINKTLPSLGLMFTSEEEVEGNNGPGILLSEKGYSCDLAFIPDGGDNWHIVEEARGILNVELKIGGKSAHGARPWKGESAITKLFQVGEKLKKMYPSSSEKYDVTINYGKISGGSAINQVADNASLWLDIRYTPKVSETEIMKNLQTTFPDIKIEIFDSLPPFFINTQNKYIQQWLQLINLQGNEKVFIKEDAATDGPYFTENNIPVIISKPNGGDIHTEQEWISLSSWIKFSELLYLFLK